jgi:hypothetical protein
MIHEAFMALSMRKELTRIKNRACKIEDSEVKPDKDDSRNTGVGVGRIAVCIYTTGNRECQIGKDGSNDMMGHTL